MAPNLWCTRLWMCFDWVTSHGTELKAGELVCHKGWGRQSRRMPDSSRSAWAWTGLPQHLAWNSVECTTASPVPENSWARKTSWGSCSYLQHRLAGIRLAQRTCTAPSGLGSYLPGPEGPQRTCFADFKSLVGHFHLSKNMPSSMPREESADKFVQSLNCEKKKIKSPVKWIFRFIVFFL